MTNPRKTAVLFFSIIFAVFLSSMAFGQEDPRGTLKDYDPSIETEKPDPAPANGTPEKDSESFVKSKDVKKDGTLEALDGFKSILDQLIEILRQLVYIKKPKQTTKPPPKPLIALTAPPAASTERTGPSPGSNPTSRTTPPPGGSAPSHRSNPSAGSATPNTPASSGGSIASAPVPASNARGGLALLGWLQQAGFTGEALRTAWAIGMRESRGNPRAHNDNARTRDDSYGLFQINMLGRMGPDRMRRFGISSYDELLDPMVSCRAMFLLSREGTDFGPWGLGPHAYRRSAQLEGNFRRYYDQFPPTG